MQKANESIDVSLQFKRSSYRNSCLDFVIWLTLHFQGLADKCFSPLHFHMRFDPFESIPNQKHQNQHQLQ